MMQTAVQIGSGLRSPNYSQFPTFLVMRVTSFLTLFFPDSKMRLLAGVVIRHKTQECW